MLEGRLWYLTMDLDENSFWTSPAVEDERPEVVQSQKRSLQGEVRFVDVQKMEGEPTSAGHVVLGFQPKGLVEPAVIHLAGPGGSSLRLIVKAFSGRVQIEEGYGEENGK